MKLAKKTRLDYLKQKYAPLFESPNPVSKLAPDQAASSERAEPLDCSALCWDEVQSLDPSPRKRHLDWILGLITRELLKREDYYKVPLAIDEFKRVTPLMRRDGVCVDLNQYKTLPALHRAISPYASQLTPAEIQAQERAQIDLETDYLIVTPELLVVSPKTEKASCFWGQGTRWCTAATESDNAFEFYNKGENKLFIFIDKKNQGAKYQLSWDGGSFFDQHDESISLESALDFYHRTQGYSMELSASIVASFPEILEQISQPPELCLNVVKRESRALEYILCQSEALILEAVKKHGGSLAYAKRQSPEICKTAIEESPYALRYIWQQTEELCKLAVSKNGGVLASVLKQTPEICILAVKNYPVALFYVRDQTDEVCLAAISKDPKCLRSVRTQTPELCLQAVSLDGRALEYVKDKTPDIIMAALENHGQSIQWVENKTPEMCKRAVESDWRAIEFIDNPSDELCIAAYKQNARALDLMKEIPKVIRNDLSLNLPAPQNLILSAPNSNVSKEDLELVAALVFDSNLSPPASKAFGPAASFRPGL